MSSVNDQPSFVSQQDTSTDSTHSEDIKKREAFIRLLESWREEDEQEQIETLKLLQQFLDEDRFSDRKLFPPT